MAQRSTAKFVSYDLRPGKQIERKMMLDSFGAAIESGFGLSEYRYVGMGGNRFYDFILVHKYLGIEKMVSLEYDKRMLPRVLYNLPYNFIDVKNLDVQEFLARDRYAGNTIYWMDYDGSIGTNVTGDVASLAPRVKSGDFVFTTVCGAPPKRFRKMNSKERVEEVKEMFRELGESVTKEDMEDAQFAIGVDKILNAAFTNAFAARRGSAFRPFFQVGYKDGQDMVTFGGVLASAEEFKRFSKMLKHRVPFLVGSKPKRYQIKKFDLTERERRLFDRAATATRSNAREIGELRRLGFEADELQRYRELLRYHPRYVETLL